MRVYNKYGQRWHSEHPRTVEMLIFSLMPHLYHNMMRQYAAVHAASCRRNTVRHSHCICWQVLPPPLWRKRELNLKQIPHFRLCTYVKSSLYADNWATQNSKLYIEGMFVYCIVCRNLFTACQQVALTNPYSTPWEANSSSASQEIPRVLWNPKVPYCTHNSPPPVPILSHTYTTLACKYRKQNTA